MQVKKRASSTKFASAEVSKKGKCVSFGGGN